jgi:hypothetical protein
MPARRRLNLLDLPSSPGFQAEYESAGLPTIANLSADDRTVRIVTALAGRKRHTSEAFKIPTVAESSCRQGL